jgi:hypothetical protein
MSAKDHYHTCVVTALTRDGWIITDDPYTIPIGLDRVFVDLGAEAPIAAEKPGQKIAIEIKSFRSPSDIHDLELALGQYVFYRSLMENFEPERKLFLAVSETVYQMTLLRPIAEIPLEKLQVALIIFDPDRQEIVRWIR